MSVTPQPADATFGGTIPDPGVLARWLEENLPPASQPPRIEKVNGGASNLLFRVRNGSETYALRRPPVHANDATSNNLARELTLMTALRSTNVRHARLIAGTADTSVIGAPFEILEWIDGFTPRDPMTEPFASDLATRRTMGFEVVDALADVANVDWRQAGLGHFGKPDGFLQRQVPRWLGQLERYRVRDLPHLDDLSGWLEGARPATQRAGLIHGDFSFFNVMFASGTTARLAAIVDWESATIGDPLLDLG
jgi:aminoglycoside phosphotransferase (APT) family kinase protein